MFRIILITLALASFPNAHAQSKKWTPPPAIELAGLIGQNNKLAAQKIRASWGKPALESGKQKAIEQTRLGILPRQQKENLRPHPFGRRGALRVRERHR